MCVCVRGGWGWSGREEKVEIVQEVWITDSSFPSTKYSTFPERRQRLNSGVGPAQFQKSTQFLGLLLTAEQLLQALHWHAWLVYGLGCSRGDAPAGALVSSEEWHPQASPAQLLWGTAPVCPSAAWAPAWLDLPTARRVNGKSSVL